MFVFLITDIEHSSQLWAEAQEAMGRVIEKHNRLVSSSIEAFGGKIFRHTGDGFFATFPINVDVLSCALEIQRKVNTYEWPVQPFRLRIALHCGEAGQMPLPSRPAFAWQKHELIGPHVALTEILASHTRGGHITFTSNVLKYCPLPERGEATPLQTFLFGRIPPQQVYSLRHPDLPTDAQAALRAPLPTFELPRFEGEFLGREVQLSRLRVLLEQTSTRLVSIVGPSGIGKSRLATEVAHALAASFPAGVLFLNLEQYPSQQDLAQLILRALNIPIPKRLKEYQETLIQTLKSRRLLIILDSFNHYERLTPIIQLLKRTIEPRILVTSLHPLGLPGEEVLQLDGLPYAPETASPSEVKGYAAAQLFLYHAQKNNPQFQPDTACWRAIQRICQSVDGFPLAIELAASWVGTLPCNTIADEIEKDLSILQANEEDRPRRHYSLRTAFEHTWRYLSPELRTAYLRLAIFQGPFSMEDARIICQVSADQIQSLRSLGLIRRDTYGRYRLPTVLNRLARERWNDSGSRINELDLAKQHATRYFQLLASLNPALKGGQQLFAIRQIQRSWDAIVTAFNNGLQLGENPEKLDLVVESLFLFLFYQGWYEEGLRLFSQGCEAHSPHANRTSQHRVLQAELLALKGWFLQVLGAGDGLTLLLEARSYFSAEEAPLQFVLLTNLAGYLYWNTQQPAKAIPLLQQGLELARQANIPWHEAFALNYLGNAQLDENQLSQAITSYQAALGIRESIGDTIGEAITLNNLGFVYKDLHQYDRVLNCFHLSLNMARESNLLPGMALAMVNLGEIALKRHQYEQATLWLREALELRQQVGYKIGVGIASQVLGIAHYHQGNLTTAIDYLKDAERIFREQPVSEYLAHTLIHLGIVAWMQGNPTLAQHQITSGIPDASTWGKALAAIYLFHACLATEDTEKASEYLAEAVGLIRESDHPDLTELMEDAAIASCVCEALLEKNPDAAWKLAAFQAQNSNVAPRYYTATFWLQKIDFSFPNHPPGTLNAKRVVTEFCHHIRV